MESSELIYNLGLRLFNGSVDDAMDFTQDVFIYAGSRYSFFDGKSSFSTWVYTVARNFGINQLKRLKKIIYTEDDTVLSPLQGQNIMSDSHDALISEETSQDIREQLKSLPEAYRLPLVLYYFEKMTYSEMSTVLEIPEGTLKSAVHRGKTLIRQALEKRGINES